MKRQHPTDENLFWCYKCKTFKHRREFHKDNRSIHGIQGQCRECCHVGDISKPRITKRQHQTDKTLFLCSKCLQYKPAECFYKLNHSSIGIQSYCKKCSKKSRGDSNYYYHKNKAKILEKYKQSHPAVYGQSVCKTCQKIFETDSSKKRYIYCSPECRKNYRKKFYKSCRCCGKGFWGESKSLYCSSKCVFDEQTIINCPICGKARVICINTPEYKGDERTCMACSDKARNTEKRKKLHIHYISSTVNIPVKELTPELVETVRYRIIVKRTLKKLKHLIREVENESDRDVISGEQHKDEAVDEVYRGCEEAGHGGDRGLPA